MSGGPPTKKTRHDADEAPANDYELDGDGDVTKKVPILRISLAGQNILNEKENTAPVSYGRGMRAKSIARRAEDGSEEQQRITRRRGRPTGRTVGDDADAGRKRRHRGAQEPLDIDSIVERQVNTIPDDLTEGEKILYQPPYSGAYNFKKRMEKRWVEDMKKDQENAKKAAGSFGNMLLFSENRLDALDQIFAVKKINYESVPKQIRHEADLHELFLMQDGDKEKLSQRMQFDQYRLQLTYQQEYARMEQRKNGTAPKMSAVRVFREDQIQNPLILDQQVPTMPEIDRAAFDAKVAKGQKKLAKTHKMDAEHLYNREEWKAFLKQTNRTEKIKMIDDLVTLTPVQELNLQFPVPLPSHE